MNDLLPCHICDKYRDPSELTEISHRVYECDLCWKTTGGDLLTGLDRATSKDLTKAILLVIEWLTDNNVHTIAAMLEYEAGDLIETYSDLTPVPRDPVVMLQAYKAAQLIISGTQ
jgi:hypothetical protein